jgi:hypothetical protein
MGTATSLGTYPGAVDPMGRSGVVGHDRQAVDVLDGK